MAYKALPPQSELQQLFDYSPETGELRWKHRPASLFKDKRQPAAHNAAIWNAKNAGNVACSAQSTGYLETSIWRRRVLAHRVIWKIVYGHDPLDIDHINGNRMDNRLVNLRDVSHAANGRNLAKRSANTSGVIGVSERKDGRWIARISPDRQTVYLGIFDSFDDAVAARRAAEVKHNYHPNHGRR